jgi:hypothetical protein
MGLNLEPSEQITKNLSPADLAASLDVEPPAASGKTFAELSGMVDKVLVRAG